MSYWSNENFECCCNRGFPEAGEAQFAVGSTGPICTKCVQEFPPLR